MKAVLELETAAVGGMNNTAFPVRRVRPDDVQRELALFDTMSPRTRHFRFLHSISALSGDMLRRFTQVDFNRDMALAAIDRAGTPDEAFVGVARYFRETDLRAEFAIAISDAWHRRGLGRLLMTALIDQARQHGVRELVGYIHRTNAPMTALMRALDFKLVVAPEDPSLWEAWYLLDEKR